ncbi:MAG: hypothetical protein GF365_03775, partial [Candidatus Buchananbacteria bacterium]|nr:hypothetical protein [Candidatus Buchananbacteria bacterium]
MLSKLRKLIFWKYFSFKAKLILVLFFLLFFSFVFWINYDPALSGSLEFYSSTDYITGQEPWRIISADLNNDNNLDLITANRQPNNVSVLLANGDGTFQAKVDYNTDTSPIWVEAADLNNDNNLDLITANQTADSISVLLGNGDGTFQSSVEYPANNETASVYAGDLNHDDDLDLVVANLQSDNISVFMGNGDGTFQPKVDYVTDTKPWVAYLADLNNDGDLDAATVNESGSSISILLGNGDGTFQPKVDYNADAGSWAIEIADFNQDNNLDIITANYVGNSMSILLGNGDGTFQPKIDYATGTNPWIPGVADLNFDNYIDIIVPNLGSDNIYIYLGNGDGTFQSPIIYSTNYNPADVETADFNKDGILDFAVANQNIGSPPSNVTVYLNKILNISCNLAPSNLKVGSTVTINASLTFTPSNIWATIENEDNLINTIILNDQGGGDYSNSVSTASNYLGQNNVAVFATDSGTGETVTCNPSTGTNWRELTFQDIPWRKRNLHQAIAYDNKMYLMGGHVDDFVNDIWSSPDGQNWTQLTDSAPWAKRGNFGLIEFNGKIWLMGGNMYETVTDTNTYVYYNDIWSSTNGRDWTLENNSAPWGDRSLFDLTIFDNKLWLSGGLVKTAGPTFTYANDVWYTSDGINWTQATGAATWPVRGLHQMLAYDDGSGEKLWVIGGQSGSTSMYADVWSSADGITWAQATNTAAWGVIPGEPGRSMHQSFVYDDGTGLKMWFLGGKSHDGTREVNYNDVYNSSDGITWNLINDPGFKHQPLGSEPSSWVSWTARRTFPSIVFDNKMWVLGGYEFRVRSWNDVWYSTNGTDWTLIGDDYGGVFGPRWYAPLANFNDKLWILGGASAGTGLTNDIWSSNDGHIWTQELANNNSPGPSQWSQRLGHRAIVFDNKLWVVGGCFQGSGACLGYCVGGPNDGQQCVQGSDCGAGNICQDAILDDVWYTSDGISWTQSAAPSWLGRYAPTLNIFNDGTGDKLWLAGGYIRGKCNGGTYSGSICLTNAQCPGGSCSSYCVGGVNKGSFCTADSQCDGSVCRGVGVNNFLNDIWFSDDGINWYSGYCNGGVNDGAACDANADCDSNVCQILTADWSGRYVHATTAYNDGSGEKLWVMGGWGVTGGSPAVDRLNDVWYTADGISWTQATASAPWTPRYTHEVLTYNDKMFLFGGNQPSNFLPALWTDDVWSSTDGANWTEVTDDAEFAGRDFFDSAIFQNRMVFMGGDSNGGQNNDVWASRLDTLVFSVNSTDGPETPPSVAAPANLTCQAQSNEKIRWLFDDQADNETGFKLYDANTDRVVLDTLPSITTNLEYFDELDLSTNSQYSRYVTAFSGSGESSASNTASCYTLANTPLTPVIGEIGEEYITVILEANDGNPPNTEYAIYEINNAKYVQADGSFGETETWQTYEDWGGADGVAVVGTDSQLTMALDTSQEYGFAAKARNGDGIETDFSTGTTGTEPLPAGVSLTA